jgi:hypothetical protein
MLSIWAGFSSLWAQHYQKGYNEEEPAWTKNITPVILEFPKNKIFVLVNQNVFTGVFALFLMFFHSYSCRNVFIHQYKYLVFGKFQNRRGNIFCSRWFLFIISFLVLFNFISVEGNIIVWNFLFSDNNSIHVVYWKSRLW